MKKLNLLFAACAALSLAGCGYASVDAGEEAVLVRKPWFFGSGGVDMTPIQTGSQVVASSTDVVKIPVTPLSFDLGFDNMMPKDGIPLDFHTTVRVQVTNTPLLVRDWNGGATRVNADGDKVPSYSWFNSNITPVYTNLVRQEVKNYTMTQLAFEGRAIDQIDQRVTAKLDEFIRRNKIPIRLLSVTIGRAIPPQEILDQRTATAEQQQRLQTEYAKQKAEEARKGAELARAEADNAYRVQMQWTPEQLIETKRIEMLKIACAQGTCIFGGGTPIINTGR